MAYPPEPVRITEVFGGRFYCGECGNSWVGTWHGPKEKITCLVCGKLLYSEEISEMPSRCTCEDDGLEIPCPQHLQTAPVIGPHENLNRTAAEITNDARRGVIDT